MILTEDHIDAIKAAALPIDYGSLLIHIGKTSPYLDIDVLNKLRLDKKPESTEGWENPSKISA